MRRPVQTGMHLPGQPPLCAPPQLRPMYLHQMASASYLLHPPQPQAPPMSWQPRAPVSGPSSAPALLTAATGSTLQCSRPCLMTCHQPWVQAFPTHVFSPVLNLGPGTRQL